MHVGNYSPRQLRHLGYISELTTDTRYVPGTCTLY